MWALPPVWSAATVIAPVVLSMVVPAAMVALSPTMESVTPGAFAGVLVAENDSPATGGTVTRLLLTLTPLRPTRPLGWRNRPGDAARAAVGATDPSDTATACRSAASAGALIRRSPAGVGVPGR